VLIQILVKLENSMIGYGLDYLSLGVGAMMIPAGLEVKVDSQKSRKA